MRRIIVFVLLTIITLSACHQEKFRIISKKDTNGYRYITVTNDPFRARVYTLGNGLKVYLSRHTDQPRISALIGVKAGSAYEKPDATGLAHYLEHMMFKGTSRIGAMDWEKEKVLLEQISDLFELYRKNDDRDNKKMIYRQIDSLSNIAATYVATNELDKLYKALGDNMLNAGTSYESTIYLCEVPKNEIEKWAIIESERFTDIVLRLFHTELETVYEEFNMYQDMDATRVDNKLMKMLFPDHPYGRDVIGLPEHLKNPSMVEIREFINNFYVPNNMAISLSGDFDFEEMIQLIDRYFGKWERSEVKKPERPVEPALTEIQEAEVRGPEEEYVSIGWRTAGTGTKDELLGTIVASLLYNRQAGLFDINLNQAQKVKNSSASISLLKDYGIFTLEGTPRQGQTLEEVKGLMLGELRKIGNGEFEDWMMEAIINNAKVNYMQTMEMPFIRAYLMINSFIDETPYNKFVGFIDNLSTVTKEQVIDFANDKLGNNYAIVYKRLGENAELVKVEKPDITPVNINRDYKSDFAKELMAMKSPAIEPLFVDFGKAMTKENIRQGIDLYHSENLINGLFTLTYMIDAGKDHNLKLPVAFRYAKLLGTEKLSPEELRKELYRHGLTMSMTSTDRYSTITLTGLDEKLNKGIELIEDIIANIKPSQEILNAYIDNLLKERDDEKKNLRSIRTALENYSLYGTDSPTLYQLPEEELKGLSAEELTDIIKEITSYPHMISYYGPRPADGVRELLTSDHKTDNHMKELPALTIHKPKVNDKPVVYVVDFDISQANISITANCEAFTPSLVSDIQIFNNYYNPIVFQEIREAKGLAYTATASLPRPDYADQMINFRAFMSTQADKLGIAINGMTELMKKLPGDEKSFRTACDGLMNSIATQRITGRSVFNTWHTYRMLGIDYDIRKDTYEKTATITLPEMEVFFDRFIADRNYSYLVIGNKKLIDYNVLNKLGKVETLTLKTIFGY